MEEKATKKKRVYKRFIVLIVGKSGSGKSFIAKMLESIMGWKTVQSYTTRPKRYEGEEGHIFVTEKDIPPEKEMVASTVFDRHTYWATQNQIEECQTYIVDVKGLEEFKKRYKGSKRIVVVYVACDERTREKRMLARGDNIYDVTNRVYHDREVFGKFEDNPKNYDVKIYNNDVPYFTLLRRLSKAVREIGDALGEKLVRLD